MQPKCVCNCGLTTVASHKSHCHGR